MPCDFGYDATAPSVSVTGPSSVPVNKPATFTLTGSELAGANGGVSSGLAYLTYSADSYSSGTKIVPTGVGATRTARITVTPTYFGTSYLYVAAVDRAGNRSATATYSYYVSG